MIRTKFDYQPLLAPGRHRMTRAQIPGQFVIGRGPKRLALNFSLNKLLDELECRQIVCEVWIDGSFACEKDDPSDIDLVVVIWHEVFDALEDGAQEFLMDLMDTGTKYDGCIDAWVCVERSKDHPDYELDNPEDYVQLFGTEHSEEWLKGFVVLEFGG